MWELKLNLTFLHQILFNLKLINNKLQESIIKNLIIENLIKLLIN